MIVAVPDAIRCKPQEPRPLQSIFLLLAMSICESKIHFFSCLTVSIASLSSNVKPEWINKFINLAVFLV